MIISIDSIIGGSRFAIGERFAVLARYIRSSGTMEARGSPRRAVCRAHGDPQMSNDDDGVYQSSANHEQSRKRRLAVAGVVALAALLGGGAYLITAKVTDGQHTDAGD